MENSMMLYYWSISESMTRMFMVTWYLMFLFFIIIAMFFLYLINK